MTRTDNLMVRPEETVIPDHLWEKLVKASDAIQSVNGLIQMFQNNAQSKLMEANNAARTAWQQIGQECGVDVVNIAWEPDPARKGVIIPRQMVLSNAVQPGPQ